MTIRIKRNTLALNAYLQIWIKRKKKVRVDINHISHLEGNSVCSSKNLVKNFLFLLEKVLDLKMVHVLLLVIFIGRTVSRQGVLEIHVVNFHE